MSVPRITQRLMVERSLFSLQTGLSRLNTSQERLSTGKIINRPSDNPSGTNDAMRLRATMAADEQHSRNAQDGLSWLGTADSALTSMLASVRSARELILQGRNTGTSGADARTALAQQLTQVREQLRDEANTTYLGRPVFGGSTAGPLAFGTDGSYLGDSNPVLRTVGTGVEVPVGVDGSTALSANGENVFAVLADAARLVTSNPDALDGVLDRLDAVTTSMKTALTDVGTRYGRVEEAQTKLSSAALANKASLADIEDVDVAEAIMDLQMQQVAYQASLGATARVLQPSLMDFLR
ncbi:MAG: flagellar hook-associated protein FlgL [Nocardioidaceae bacterium]|nr:flagellar hook-associated protein FlgL [Nocardioidaceae bacterium]NUS50553.1 flagellar hook-associated protein FlgL [Nocardioidaceae bacterium]